MQNKNTIKIGKVELPLGDGLSKHVPKNSVEFIDHDGILTALAIGIRDEMPCLLIGETGTGKTSAIRNLAERTKHGLRRVNLNGGTTADELVGKILLNEKGTIWVDGVLTEAMRNGEWILFDEINAALPEVLFVLQSVLDDDGYLVLTEKDDKEIVRKHKDFRFFASCNPPSYAGTKELNRALLSRFPICIDASYPTAKVEKEVISRHLGKTVADLDLTEAIMTLAEDTRKAYQEGKSEFAIGTRDILNFLRLSKYMGPRQALEASFIGKLSTDDQASVRAMARIHLPSDSKEVKLEHVQSLEKHFLVGGTYVIDADVHNVYGSVQKKSKTAVETLERTDLGTGYSQNVCNATKGDTFKLLGIYRQNESAVSKNPASTAPILGGLVEFRSGQYKGQVGVVRCDTKPVTDALYAQL